MTEKQIKSHIHEYQQKTKIKKDGQVVDKKTYTKWYFNYESKKYMFKSEKEAIEKFKELLSKSTAYSKIEEQYINDLLKEWFNNYINIPNKRKPSAISRINEIVRIYLMPHLDGKKVNQLTKADVLAIYDKAPSASTAKKTYVYLKKFYKDMNLLKYLSEDPFYDVKIEKPAPKQVIAFRAYELDSVLHELSKNEQYYFLFQILSETGLRIGEVLALQLGDFTQHDSGKYFINIRKSVHTSSEYSDFDNRTHTTSIDSPKTNSGTRKIQISKDLYYRFLDYVHKNHGYNIVVDIKNFCLTKAKRETQLFLTTGKKPVAYDHIYKLFKKALKKCGFEDNNFSLHTFRHTFATLALESGWTIEKLSKYLGHSSIKITYDTYIHLTEDYDEEIELFYKQNTPRW